MYYCASWILGTKKDSSALIIMGGDFNRLNNDEITELAGLSPAVVEPMARSNNIPDQLMVSVPDLFQIKVISSTICTVKLFLPLRKSNH